MTDFTSLGLSALMLKSLTRLQFSSPTPVQVAAIPLALAGRDILGTAQTGTGKTAAFGLPLVEHIAADPARHTALVITPTRELAVQVQRAIESFIDSKQRIKTALLIGGEPYFKQLKALSFNPAILIGTPGRLNDHLMQGQLDLSGVSYLVLDETDRMLDMGFSVQIDKLLAAMGDKRQTLLFSATLPPKIEQLAKTYLTDPERICVGPQSKPAEAIAQETQFLQQGEKLTALIKILSTQEGSALVFVRTKYGTERLAKTLAREGIGAQALHGDLRQRKRDTVVRAFRGQKFRVLVATDVAARGLDIPHLALVINHDLPQVAEDYVHRIGRTARAGASGLAVSFVSPAEKGLWAAITRMLGPKGASTQPADAPPKQFQKKSTRPRRGWSPMAPDRGARKRPDRRDPDRRKGDWQRADKPDEGKPRAKHKKDRERDRIGKKDKGKPAWAKRSDDTAGHGSRRKPLGPNPHKPKSTGTKPSAKPPRKPNKPPRKD